MSQITPICDLLNLRENLIIMVGGAPLTQDFANSIGADGFAEDAAGAVRKAKELLGL